MFSLLFSSLVLHTLFVVYIDARERGLGAVLVQKITLGHEETLNPAEREGLVVAMEEELSFEPLIQ